MKLKRKLTWDPNNEQFTGDAEANALRARAPRSSTYDIRRIMREARLG